MAAYVPGFQESGHGDYWRALKSIVSYDPDQIQLLYPTPHRWTPYYRTLARHRVIQTDQGRWDYKHQVVANAHLAAWQAFIWMKLMEVVLQLRPRSLARVIAHPDRGLRAAMRWYYRIGRKVWFHELWHFFFRDQRVANGPTLREFFGEPMDEEAEARKPSSPRLERSAASPVSASTSSTL
jgi:anaerobic magnesium-protoporphyrin IX monomethyl ester cyclase